jgi:hypothetical protein
VWNYNDDLQELDGTMLEFRLVYQGNLLASSTKSGGDTRSRHKHQIRRYLHEQLKALWPIRYPLKFSHDYVSTTQNSGGPAISKTGVDMIADEFSMGAKRYVPVVRSELALACGLDVLLLRRVKANQMIYEGDLDNQLKTLVDALRIPKVGEFCEGPEDPLFCLLEDDRLISEVHLRGDTLLASPSQLVSVVDTDEEAHVGQNHAIAVIHVKVLVTASRYDNLAWV